MAPGDVGQTAEVDCGITRVTSKDVYKINKIINLFSTLLEVCHDRLMSHSRLK